MAKMKTCRHNPKHILPATPEFFFRDQTKQDGLNINCKICQRDVNAGYRKIKKLRQGVKLKNSYMLQYVDKWDRKHSISFIDDKDSRKAKYNALRWLEKAPKSLREIDFFECKHCPALSRIKR